MEKPEGFIDVPNYEGLYAVSKYGEFYSYPKYKHKGKLLKSCFKEKYARVIFVKKINGKIIKKTLSAHRLVAEAFIPNPENKPFINHKDFNGLNNHVDNLEWCNYFENNTYSIKPKRVLNSKYRSNYRGVTRSPISNKIYYISRIIHNKKRIYLGTFKNEIEAAKAYNQKAKELHGKFAILNDLS